MSTALRPSPITLPMGQGGRGVSVAQRRPLTAPLVLPRIAVEMLLVFGLLLLNLAGEWGSGAFFLILVVMCLFSSSAAFKALMIMWLGLSINTAFVPKTLTWTPLRLALPYVAIARFLYDYLLTKPRFFSQPSYIAFTVYCLVMALCSVLSGWFTLIALFKLANFFAIVTGVLLGGSILAAKRTDPGEWVVTLITMTAAIGWISIALGLHHNMIRIGFSSQHFTGAFFHPNSHASYGSVFISFLIAVFAYSRYRHRWLMIPLIAMWLLFMMWSKSRTSFIATTAGLAVLLVFGGSTARLTGWIRRSNLSRVQILTSLVAAMTCFVITDLATGGRISMTIIRFINKQGDDDNADTFLDANAILLSRSGLMQYSMANFRASPIYGIGFQVAKTEEFARNATIFTAPAEKGFMPTAVLEEGGILGASCFVVWMMMLAGTFIVRRNIPALMLLSTFFTSSMTEVTLFSPGGTGAFGWIMVAAASAFGDACWTSARTNRGGAMVDQRRSFGPMGITGPGPLVRAPDHA